MHYLGHSILERKSSDAGILAAILALRQDVGALSQVCSLEAQVSLPVPVYQESTAVEQPVTLSGDSLVSYQSNGYAAVPGS